MRPHSYEEHILRNATLLHEHRPAYVERVAAATAMWRAGASEEEIREEHGKFVLEAVRLAVKGGKE